VILCKVSWRMLATRWCNLANLRIAFFRFTEPFFFLLTRRCNRTSRFFAFRYGFTFANTLPAGGQPVDA